MSGRAVRCGVARGRPVPGGLRHAFILPATPSMIQHNGPISSPPGRVTRGIRSGVGTRGRRCRGAGRTAGTGAAGGDDLQGPLGERAGLRRADPDPQHGDGGIVLADLGLLLGLGDLLRLDDDLLVVGVPRERHRADLELLLDGLVERAVVDEFGRGDGGHRGLAAAAPQHLVQELLQPFGQQRDLELLQADAGDAAAGARLQVERSVAWPSDGAGDETLRQVVGDDGHDKDPTRRRRGPRHPARVPLFRHLRRSFRARGRRCRRRCR